MACAESLRRILLIDDDDSREALALVLAARGHGVRCAVNGREGVRLAREEPSDAILLDLHMPAMDGAQTARRLRAVPALAGVPILALTAFGSEAAALGAAAQAPRADIQGCRKKSADLDMLLERVAALVSTQAAEAARANSRTASLRTDRPA